MGAEVRKAMTTRVKNVLSGISGVGTAGIGVGVEHMTRTPMVDPKTALLALAVVGTFGVTRVVLDARDRAMVKAGQAKAKETDARHELAAFEALQALLRARDSVAASKAQVDAIDGLLAGQDAEAAYAKRIAEEAVERANRARRGY